MRSLKKLIYSLSLLLAFSIFAASPIFAMDWPLGYTEVFDIKLGEENISLSIADESEGSSIIFYDGFKEEINIVLCDESEYDAVKKVAFECKVLAKSISRKKDYEQKNIYSKIIEKIKTLAPTSFETYKSTPELGHVKVVLYMSNDLSSKNPDALDFFTEALGKSKTEPETKSTESSSEKILKVWSFTDEIESAINTYYKPIHPNVQIEYSMTPSDQFPIKLDYALANGNDAPDVFSLDSSFIRHYIESDLLLPLDDLYKEVKDKMEKYPIQIASANGHVYAMTWQICPGAMFYRRSLAKRYLGTDNPKEVQKYFSNMDNLLNTARLIKNKSSGRCLLVSSYDELFNAAKGARKNPWIVNDRLTIDSAMENYLELSKILRDGGMTGDFKQWSDDWFDGMNGELKSELNAPLEVFCYFLPTWGLQYILEYNATKTSGDWAMCQGPSAWLWGGTWLAAYKGTENPKLVKEMIKYLTTDDNYLTQSIKESGDCVANIKVQEKFKDLKSQYLGGQDYYKEFCDYAKKIDGTLIQSSDKNIEEFFSEAVEAYVSGEKSKRQAIEYFKNQVSFILGY